MESKKLVNYSGKIQRRIHAFAKAQAQIKEKTIPEYINSLIVEDLKRHGYTLEEPEAAQKEQAAEKVEV